MSTKLSTDMIYNKSSTRLHAPPGGASTIFFGDYEPPSKSVVKHEPKPETPKKAPVVAVEAAVSLTPSSDSLPLVTVYVAAKEGKDETLSAIIEVFNSLPDFQNKFSLFQVESSYILPYLIQKAVGEKSADVVLAVSVTVGAVDSTLSSVLVSQSIQLGISSGIPVVPAVLNSASVASLKATLPEQVASWAQAVKDLLVPLTPIASYSTPVAPVVEEEDAKSVASEAVSVASVRSAAAGQRPHVQDVTATRTNTSRQAPGGRSSLVLG